MDTGQSYNLEYGGLPSNQWDWSTSSGRRPLGLDGSGLPGHSENLSKIST